MKILVCGGCGFIGSNFVRYILNKFPSYSVINYDKLTYAGNPENLRDIEKDPRYTFIQGDIIDGDKLDIICKLGIDSIINFAAETHVDKSIYTDPDEFVYTNVVGVHTILEAVRKNKIKKYVQVSTDEVYGSLELDDPSSFKEDTPITPNVPYAATKAAGDLLCRVQFKTFNTPTIVTHCSNNYGPYQFPEKLIPYFSLLAMEGRDLTLYGDGKNVRDWIHVLDHCAALSLILHDGKPGEVYNIGADNEISNLEIAKTILSFFERTKSKITFVADRLGHDRRYSIDNSKIKRELGWEPKIDYKQGMKETMEWYKEHKEWIQRLKERGIKFNPHLSKGGAEEKWSPKTEFEKGMKETMEWYKEHKEWIENLRKKSEENDQN